MDGLLLLDYIPEDGIDLVVQNVMLQTVDVLESDLQVVVDKALDVGGTDALFRHHHGLKSTEESNEHAECAGRLCTVADDAAHLYLRGAEHVVDLLRSQAVQECHACGSGRCRGGRTGAGGRHVYVFLGQILHVSVHEQSECNCAVAVLIAHLAVLGTCPGTHDDHQTLIAACGADHRGIVAAAHTGIGTGGTPDEDLCDLIVSNKAALYVVLQDLCGLYAHAAGIFQTVLSDDVVHLDCFLCAAELAYGSGLAPVVSVLQAGANPVLAGLSFGGCSILLVAAYMSSIGKELSGYKKKYTTVICIIGAAAISVTVGILGLCHLGNIAESSQAAIPNLLIANQVFGSASGILGAVFAVIILLSIYSTFCPMLWTCVSTFIKDEKSVKYKLACVLAGIGVFIVDMFIPYATLVNIIMTYCGYTGGIVFLVLTVRWLMVRNQDKKKMVSE